MPVFLSGLLLWMLIPIADPRITSGWPVVAQQVRYPKPSLPGSERPLPRPDPERFAFKVTPVGIKVGRNFP